MGVSAPSARHEHAARTAPVGPASTQASSFFARLNLKLVAVWAVVQALSGCSDRNAEELVPLQVVHLASEDVQTVFQDATVALGLDQVGPVEQCLAPADLDGDGLEDLLFWRAGQPLIFRRMESGGFDAVEAVVLEDSGDEPFLRALACAAADLDGDGNRDLVAVGLGDGVIVLWGNGDFEYERQSYILGEDFLDGESAENQASGPVMHSPGLLLLDADLDGLIDLYVLRNWWDSLATCIDPRSPYVGYEEGEGCCQLAEGGTWYLCAGEDETGGPRNQLLRQTEGRGFVDQSAESGANLALSAWGSSLIHANHDSIPDIFLGNDFDSNSLLLGRGDGRFEPVDTNQSRLDVRNHAMGVTTADFNADGHLDLALSQIGLPMFLVGDGHSSFSEVFPASGVEDLYGYPLSWGLTFFDVDLDGDPDLYVSAQYIGPNLDCWIKGTHGIRHGLADAAPEEVLAAQHNLLYLNSGGQFEIAPHAPPVGDYRGTMVVVPVDLDGDFDEDLLALEFRVGDKDRMHLRAWENTFQGNHRARIRLESGLTNPEAIGARISVENGDTRQTFVIGGSDGYSSQRGHQLTLGLGGWPKAFVRVAWPGQPYDDGRWINHGDELTLH